MRPALKNSTVQDLLGRPMRDLRISLTDRCNFRCSYCMPEHVQFLDKEELLRFEEIELIVAAAAGLGVQKIKITGGEPTLRPDLDVLIQKIKANPQIKDIGLITNGWYLHAQGEKLHRAGLDRVSVSLDALDNQIFQRLVGSMYRYNVEPILQGIARMEELGFAPIKINVVIQRGLNESQILPLAEYFHRRNYHLRFIEFMDVGEVHWQDSKVVTSAEVYRVLSQEYELVPKEPAYFGEVAQRFTHADGRGEIGFISAISAPFCRDCTRLRLSSDGRLFGCLFSDKGLSLKPYFRDSSVTEGQKYDKLTEILQQFWQAREDRYSENRHRLKTPQQHKNMHFMGG